MCDFIKYFLYAVICIFIIISLMFFATNGFDFSKKSDIDGVTDYKTEDIDIKAISDYSNELHIKNINEDLINNKISAEIRNELDIEIEFIEVCIIFYDNKGDVIYDDFSTKCDFKPMQEWKFKFDIHNDNIVAYDLYINRAEIY